MVGKDDIHSLSPCFKIDQFNMFLNILKGF